MNLGACRERCNGSHAYGRCEQSVQGSAGRDTMAPGGGEECLTLQGVYAGKGAAIPVCASSYFCNDM